MAVVMGPFVHVVNRGCHALAVHVAMWLCAMCYVVMRLFMWYGGMAVCHALAIDKSKEIEEV